MWLSIRAQLSDRQTLRHTFIDHIGKTRPEHRDHRQGQKHGGIGVRLALTRWLNRNIRRHRQPCGIVSGLTLRMETRYDFTSESTPYSRRICSH
jgi:hypothetical protein